MDQTRAAARFLADCNDALFTAANSERPDLALRALQDGADPLYIHPTFGCTALTLAALQRHTECLRVLIPFSDLHCRQYDGMTALMAAAGHAECVRLLLPGSDPNAANNSGHNALMIASSGGHFSSARILLPHTDPLLTDNNGRNALHIAAASGALACAELLLTCIDPQIPDHLGRTPLAIAARHGRDACARLLLPLTANACDHAGNTAADHARANGYPGLAATIDAYYACQAERAEIGSAAPTTDGSASHKIKL